MNQGNSTSYGSPVAENGSMPRSSDSSSKASNVSEAVSNAVGQVQEQFTPVLQQTQQKAGELAGQVKDKAASKIDETLGQAAGSLTSVADVLRHTGQHLRESDQSPVTQYAAQYGDQAAEQVERLSTYLRDHHVREIVHEVESFARREPAVFVGGAFLLGLLGARFLKSSAPASGTGYNSGSSWASRESLAVPASNDFGMPGYSSASGVGAPTSPSDSFNGSSFGRSSMDYDTGTLQAETDSDISSRAGLESDLDEPLGGRSMSDETLGTELDSDFSSGDALDERDESSGFKA